MLVHFRRSKTEIALCMIPRAIGRGIVFNDGRSSGAQTETAAH
jgi:hypothetical protein